MSATTSTHGNVSPAPLSPLHLALIERMREGVILIGADGRIVAANPVAGRVLHYGKGQLVGLALEQITDLSSDSLSSLFPSSPMRIPFYTKHRNVVACEVRWAGESDGCVQLIFEPAKLTHADEALHALTVGTATAVGDDFIYSLARHTALVLNYRFALVGELLTSPPRIRTLAMWNNDAFHEPLEYPLPGTPCEHAVNFGPCFIGSDLISRFPDDPWLVDVGAQSYLGMPILNAQGDAIGIISAIHTEPKDPRQDMRPVLSIFAARAAAEFERKRAETALRESELRYRRLVEDNPNAIVVHGDGIIVYANDAAVHLVGGASGSDVIGLPILDFVHPDFREIASRRMTRLYELRETPPLMQQKVVRLDGTVIDVEITGIPILLDGVNVVQTILRDITANVLAQHALRESEARFRTIYERAPVMMHSIDEKNIICNVNEKWLDETGFTRGQVLGKPLLAFLAPDSHAAEGSHVTDGFWRQGYMNDEPLKMLRRDGESIDVLMSSRVIVEPDGRRVSLSVVRNIAEQRRAQEAQVRLTAAIEQAAEAIVITDAAGSIVYVNPAFEHITGYTREEAIGQTPALLQSGRHDDAFYRELWGTISKGDTWSGRFVNRKKDGAMYQEEATISPVRDNIDRIVNYVAVKRDITQEVALETQLRQAQKMEAVGQLAGGIAHDFNNLLQAIVAHATLGMEMIADNEPARDDFNEIRNAAVSAASLTRQLLAFSRRQVLQAQDLNLNEVIDTMLKMLRRVIGEQIELVFVRDEDLGTVHVDPHQIEQVLMNLCVNSRDAMPEGGVVRIETGNVTLDDAFQEAHPWSRPGNYAVMSFADTGSGMNEATLNRIFEPFFTTKEFGRGTGLGLATVYGIVKQHNGLVHVYSEVNKGTTFKIYLPRVTRVSKPLRSSTLAATAGGSELVLLAEDEALVRNATARVLEKHGYRVLAASDGVEAVELFKQHQDDVAMALLDIAMPKMGGIEAAQRLRALRPDVRVLFCSGYGAAALQNLEGFEPIALIEKPYTPTSLLTKMREILDGRLQGASKSP